ncbi:MAG: glycerate kinase, partial [Succinivibrionaceae bacterium]|nr:glycerate kinase [Succinivibrionaceae bacterium]
AAGGLGAGLMLFTHGMMRPGIGLVLDAIGFEEIIRGADLIITGEGFTDSQTAQGKAPAGIAARAARQGIPVICLSGGISEDADDLHDLGIDALMGAVAAPCSLEDCMRDAERHLEDAAARCLRLVRVGMRLRH